MQRDFGSWKAIIHYGQKSLSRISEFDHIKEAHAIFSSVSGWLTKMESGMASYDWHYGRKYLGVLIWNLWSEK